MSKIERLAYWLRRRLWSLREAAYLLNGEEPRSEAEFEEKDWCKPTAVGQAYDLIKEATLEGGGLWSTDVGKFVVRRRIRAGDVIAWAISQGVTIPSELATLARAKSDSIESARTPPPEANDILQPASESVARSGTVRRLSSRRDDFAPVIEMVQTKLADPTDTAAAWVQLVALAAAREPIPPLIGLADGEVKYRTAEGIKCIGRDAFVKRLKRRAANRR